jgi:hypothetical protein
MPFIRSKNIRGRVYFYLCESFWENGKPRQRVLCYLGKHSTVKAAFGYWQEQAKATKGVEERKHAREMVKKLKQYV